MKGTKEPFLICVTLLTPCASEIGLEEIISFVSCKWVEQDTAVNFHRYFSISILICIMCQTFIVQDIWVDARRTWTERHKRRYTLSAPLCTLLGRQWMAVSGVGRLLGFVSLIFNYEHAF